MKRLLACLLFACVTGLLLLFPTTRHYCTSCPSETTNLHVIGLPEQVVVYNRVPKTGSTSLVNLVYELLETNNIGISLVNITGKPLYLSKPNQLSLIQALDRRSLGRPFFLHGHFAYLNFHALGSRIRPIYINLIRDPLERLVSYYYFRRYGDDYRPNKVRNVDLRSQPQTFDECVRLGATGCQPKNLWVQIPMFCGHAAYCRIPGNREALELAKRRVIEDYLIVGVTEAFDDFILVLERLLPRFFNGSVNLIQSSNSWQLRRTRYKRPISNATRYFFQQNPVWRLEQEFYDFVRYEFWSLRNSLIRAPPLLKLKEITVANLSWSTQKYSFIRERP